MATKRDLNALFRLEFYKKQKNWLFVREAQKLSEEQETVRHQRFLNETYTVSSDELNDAFIDVNSSDSPEIIARNISVKETVDVKSITNINDTSQTSKCQSEKCGEIPKQTESNATRTLNAIRRLQLDGLVAEDECQSLPSSIITDEMYQKYVTQFIPQQIPRQPRPCEQDKDEDLLKRHLYNLQCKDLDNDYQQYLLQQNQALIESQKMPTFSIENECIANGKRNDINHSNYNNTNLNYINLVNSIYRDDCIVPNQEQNFQNPDLMNYEAKYFELLYDNLSKAGIDLNFNGIGKYNTNDYNYNTQSDPNDIEAFYNEVLATYSDIEIKKFIAEEKAKVNCNFSSLGYDIKNVNISKDKQKIEEAKCNDGNRISCVNNVCFDCDSCWMLFFGEVRHAPHSTAAEIILHTTVSEDCLPLSKDKLGNSYDETPTRDIDAFQPSKRSYEQTFRKHGGTKQNKMAAVFDDAILAASEDVSHVNVGRGRGRLCKESLQC